MTNCQSHLVALKHEFLVTNIFKQSIPTAQNALLVSIIKTTRLQLYKTISASYCDNHIECINILCQENAEIWNPKASGTCNAHSNLKC
jgi:hypothetical protein